MRAIDRTAPQEIELVAARMRLTLMEVLDPKRGEEMYSMPWLCDRVRWHLDPAACTGEVFVAQRDDQIVGHTIVRLENDDSGAFGLFSTIYVEPSHRAHGVATALVEQGERWFTERGMTSFATNTSETNTKLIKLFEKHGYAIVLHAPDVQMIQLRK